MGSTKKGIARYVHSSAMLASYLLAYLESEVFWHVLRVGESAQLITVKGVLNVGIVGSPGPSAYWQQPTSLHLALP